MKNKRGFLLGEETLKIIISVIAIIFLVYLLASLYFNSSKNKELDLAKASIENIIKEINSGATEVQVYNPKGWVIISWPDQGIVPEKCRKNEWENCLCICDDVIIKNGQNFADECDKKGECLETNEKINFDKGDYIKIQNPPLILGIK
jgi:hypothetical protein